jgi:MFS family permease
VNPKSRQIQSTYLTLTLLSTLAASFIWGINTLFLLDAGLTNIQAFAANAFFTVGQVLFEVPTGVVADTWGRRTSYLLGALTLGVSTLLYWWTWQIHGPFWMWAATSILLGLGFTFFSGATEAWLVDALKFTGFKGNLEQVFSKGQMMGGVAMLAGSVAGGVIAQATNLGVPYILRSAVLGLTFVAAWLFMKDLGYTPKTTGRAISNMKHTLDASIQHGLKNPPVRWMMLAAPFGSGVGFYAFYAMQPYLLQLYGDSHAYSVAGLAAAIIAGAQIIGGLTAANVKKVFAKRTTALAAGVVISAFALWAIGSVSSFYLCVALLMVWGLIFAAVTPVRQAYLNGLIPSSERATVLSFDSLMGSSGGVAIQPILGRVADASGYAASYLVGAGIQLLALPFLLLARREKPASDTIV